jgi:hypothetical protein
MSPRSVLILLIAGLALVGLAVYLSSTRHLEHATLAGDLVVPGLDGALNSITEVRLTKGDATHTTLKRGSDGWSVSERNYPADTGKVRKLLLDIRNLNVVEEKTRLPANYPQLGVEDVTTPKATGTRVELVTPARTFALIIGKSSSAKSGFVRVANVQQSLLAAPLVTVDADPKRWLDQTLIDLPIDKVKAMDVKPAEGASYSASREKKEQQDFAVTGIPKGRQLTSPSAADPIAGSLSLLTLEDVRKAASAGDAKLSQIVFHSFDGLDVTVSGRKDGSHDLVTIAAHSSTKESEAVAQTLSTRLSGWEFEIPSYKYDAIFRPLEDLLQKPPEPKKTEKKTDKKKAHKADAAKAG